MTLEQRLRDDLAREAERINPDVHAALFAAQWNQHPPHRSITRVTVIAVAAAVLAIVPLAIVLTRTGGTSASQQPTAPSASLVGMFATQVPYQDGVVEQHHLNGTWVMNISADGTIDLTPPHDTTDVRVAPAPFAPTGHTTATNVFAEDLCQAQPNANYRWQVNGSRLQFESINDRCPARIAVLTSEPWHTGSA